MTYRVILRTGQHFEVQCDHYQVREHTTLLFSKDKIVGTLYNSGIAAVLNDGVAQDAKPSED